MSKKERDELDRVFKSMDKNSDGSLSKQELIDGYEKILGNKEKAVTEVNRIMAEVDTENKGSIDYSSTIL